MTEDLLAVHINKYKNSLFYRGIELEMHKNTLYFRRFNHDYIFKFTYIDVYSTIYIC